MLSIIDSRHDQQPLRHGTTDAEVICALLCTWSVVWWWALVSHFGRRLVSMSMSMSCSFGPFLLHLLTYGRWFGGGRL